MVGLTDRFIAVYLPLKQLFKCQRKKRGANLFLLLTYIKFDIHR